MKAVKGHLSRHLKNRTIKNRSILISWLISYISILLIPIVISAFVYLESTRIVEREIINNNVIMLKQIQKVIDKKISDVEHLSLQIAWNPKLKTLFYNSKPMDSRGRFTVSQIQKDFRVYKIANGYIDELYVYFHNSDMIVNSITSYNIDLLETLLVNEEKIGARQFETLSQQEFMHFFTPMEIWKGTEEKVPAIAYIQSLPYGLNNNITATMLILLDYHTFLDEISNIEGLGQGTVLILDENSHIIAATNPYKEPSELYYGEFQDDVLLHKNIGDQEFVMSSISSQMNGWKYIFSLPSTVFMEKVKYIKSLIGYSIILCLIIGGIVAYIFTKKNYNPIQEMVKALANHAGIKLNSGLDEYTFIKQAINSTLNEKELIQQKLERQNLALRSSFLARLIKGIPDQVVPVDEALYSYEIQWISDGFCVMLFYIEDFKQLFAEGSLPNSSEQLKLVQFIITNIVEELIGKRHLGVVTEVDDMMACLVNINEEHVEEIKRELVDISTEVQCFIRDNFFVHLTISIGDIHKTMAGIPQSYQEAQEAMEYRMVMGSERIIRYDEIENSGDWYDYPLEMEQQLINSIKIGDLNTAQCIISDVFKRHFSGEVLSVEMTKCLLFDLMSTMIKALNDINIPDSNTFVDELNPIARLSGSDTVMEMKYQMTDILKRVCEYVESSKKDRSQKIAEQIILIIEKNYIDANLSITSIAEEFGLTGPYVSKIFKEQMGEGIQDYINKVRLKQAKTLLMKEHTTLQRIAKRVGYSNSNGLIRVFKKYEGLTPGQFREISR